MPAKLKRNKILLILSFWKKTKNKKNTNKVEQKIETSHPLLDYKIQWGRSTAA